MIDNLKQIKELLNFSEKGDFYIEDAELEKFEIVETTRIGIDYAEEAIDFPWRFYIKGNKYISKK